MVYFTMQLKTMGASKRLKLGFELLVATRAEYDLDKSDRALASFANAGLASASQAIRFFKSSASTEEMLDMLNRMIDTDPGCACVTFLLCERSAFSATDVSNIERSGLVHAALGLARTRVMWPDYNDVSVTDISNRWVTDILAASCYANGKRFNE